MSRTTTTPPARQRLRVAALALMVMLLDTASIALAQAPDLKLTPGVTVVGDGGTMRFVAVYDPDGAGPALQQYPDGSLLAWHSDNLSVLVIDQTGLALGRQPGTATVTATYGALTASAQVTVAGTLDQHSFQTPDGRTRTYLLYVPESYAGAPTPVVLAFHGGHGGNSYSLMYGSQLNNVAHTNGFVVAYPDGTDAPGGVQPSWNGGGCCGYAAANHVDDVGFTRMLIDDIGTLVNVDEQRVFATGISNGGVFSHRLGMELADRIAAIAPVAGGLQQGGDFKTKSPSRPISVMDFHGKTDAIYPYAAIPPAITYWKWKDKLLAAKKVVTYQNGIETCVTNASSVAEVTLCTAAPPVNVVVNGVVYDGGGHCWPGGVKSNVDWADVPTQDINASAAMWEFFKRHPKP